MPTAARLVSALLFMGLAYLVTDMVPALLEDGQPYGYLYEITVALGAICGWTIMGPRAEYGGRDAIGGGVTTGAALFITATFVQAFMRMIKLSMRGRYDNAPEAVAKVFEIWFEFAMLIATPKLLITLVLGSVIAGSIAGGVGRRWS
ncbi:TrgA family protein [Cochlodiniinecator piscidefendens]|uniref:TrgA family protein n=1 Tax=Cochlodiniinecator piscidefendens TaxID=2715756 RepID=UPI00140E3D5E|nr:TrgA family protein [Cochlodiniinecator piscidefendens]